MKVIFLILIFIFMTSCTACIKKPTPIMEKNEKGEEVLAIPLSCYYYEVCEYYKTVDKKSHGDCKAEFIKCSKDMDYDYCKHPENWPVGVTFQQCWDKKQ